MDPNPRTLHRRQFLRIALTAAALTPVAGGLASCAAGGGDAGSESSASTGAVSATNPFGVPENSAVDAVIFNGGYGIAYVELAAEKLQEVHPT